MLRGGFTKVSRERTAGDRQGFFYSKRHFSNEGRGLGRATMYDVLDSLEGKGDGPKEK